MERSRSSKQPLEVWRVNPDHNFQGINFDLKEPGGFLETYPQPFRGQSMRAKWKAWRAYIADPMNEKGDFFSFLDGLGIRPTAKQAVGRLLESAGELLPMEIEGEGLCHVFNCTCVSVDALDPDRSVRRVLAGKWLMEPTKYVFRPQSLRGLSIFRIPEDLGSMFIVRGEDIPSEHDFYLLYKQSKLTGLKFGKVWSEEIWR